MTLPIVPEASGRQFLRHAFLFYIAFVVACASAAPPRLSYEGHSVVVARNPTVVDAVVTVRNIGSVIANFRVPPCPLWIAVYGTPERKGQPLWKSGSDTCVSTGMIFPPIVIAPGDYYDFRLRETIPLETSGRDPVYLSMSVPPIQADPVGTRSPVVRQVPVGQLGPRFFFEPPGPAEQRR